MVYAEWQVGQVVWSMLWFTLLFLWIWVLLVVFGDVFRSRDLGGPAKALWTLFVLFMPVLGVFTYLIVRGDRIGERRLDDARAADRALRVAMRSAVADDGSDDDDLRSLVGLRERGVIDDAEFQAMKARIVPT
ncbi:MAG TPA: PLDc N-terminal domain-containing protein [Acidimicrobiales bacterium]